MAKYRQKLKIGGIIQNRELAKIGVMSVPDRPGVAGTIFDALGAEGINCAFIVHTIDLNNQDSIVLCVARKDLERALRVLDASRAAVGAREVVYEAEVGMISVFGPHFGQLPGVAGVMFSALASASINILAISTSISSLSCIIDVSQMDEAVEVVREAFEPPDTAQPSQCRTERPSDRHASGNGTGMQKVEIIENKQNT